MAIKRCYICREDIYDDLISKPKQYKNGDYYTTPKGTILYSHYHKQCLEDKEREWNEWCTLYNYLKSSYYLHDLPILLIKLLKDLRVNYTFKNMYECYLSLESHIATKVNADTFENAMHKIHFLLFMLKNNIDDFVRASLKNQVEEEEVRKYGDNFNLKLEYKYDKVYDSIDFDFLE